MRFSEKIKTYVLSLEQDLRDEVPVDPNDVQPDPNQPVPGKKQEKEKISVAPEGYVEMVRLLAKALVMNVPPDSIDSLFSTKITGENAETLKEGLEDLINTSSNYEDNPERLENPNFTNFFNSINENNFQKKFNEIIGIMKKYSNDINIA